MYHFNLLSNLLTYNELGDFRTRPDKMTYHLTDCPA